MFKAGNFTFPLGVRTYIMGILNYTPDSFSDGGVYNTPEKALERALEMQKQGADIIDLGANSTRPGGEVLSADEELERLMPALEALGGRLDIPVSVDTFYPLCAEYALDHGAVIINDVSGKFNKETAALVKNHGGGYIVTHNPCGASVPAAYPDGVVTAVRSFFLDCMAKAKEMDFYKENLCLDPGFGFSKTEADNLELLRNGEWLKFNGVASLFGFSRKRFIANSIGSNELSDLDLGTLSANTAAIAGGADILRVHNVESAVIGARTADRIYRKL